MYEIDGLVYSNNHSYSIRKGERVCWHILSMGIEEDLCLPHWHSARCCTTVIAWI